MAANLAVLKRGVTLPARLDRNGRIPDGEWFDFVGVLIWSDTGKANGRIIERYGDQDPIDWRKLKMEKRRDVAFIDPGHSYRTGAVTNHVWLRGGQANHYRFEQEKLQVYTVDREDLPALLEDLGLTA